ncbi:MBL fold metallo-hydrolase [Gracilibacillus caseinilyticus]|uniref:MBL fold metallo-hydrolase n=1 Tax=Gracilibacillus caseinilyticus TaxID=2932256 RepID=A0ABY4F1U5_9BACI|nr:MBL fold metallo-hydrolase [Gracilibacillus caseinilyticus]UOQ50142.1 MBL fold metallo-hydrolase [Gracilibacillus caseinilyticus]
MAVTAMKSAELVKRIVNKDSLFILDVRNKQAFEDWKIEGEHLEYLNVPYFDLLEGVESIIDKLPTDKEMVVVCAKQPSSVMVAEMLADKGMDVYYLEGGMKAWSEHLEPVKIGDIGENGEIYQFVRIGKGCLSYMVTSAGEAAIIDATRMTDVFLDFAEEKGVRITDVMDTHLHADHISGGRKLAETSGAKYWLPPRDAAEVTFDYHALQDGDTITIGNVAIDIQPLYTPGHTAGSTSFIIEDRYLLTGDILFIDSIGRPDLAGKADDWVDDLRETLYSRYQALPEELIVLPAHFMTNAELNDDGTVAAKLGSLFFNNHGLQVADEEKFRKMVTENLPPQPNAHQQIRDINMGKVNPDLEEQREMEIGPNRCAVQ